MRESIPDHRRDSTLTTSSRKLLYRLYHVFWQAIDLLLPPTCGGCGSVGFRWCPACKGGVSQPVAPLCRHCGEPVRAPRDRCDACKESPPHFRALRSWSAFVDPVRPALHRLKYRHDLGLGEALVPQLADFVSRLRWPVDAIVPVPLGRGRLKERGYNQAALMSWPLALCMGIAHVPQALSRTRETLSQVGLSRLERRDNVNDAFQGRSSLVRGRTIMLVDDVATTAATLSSCAKALYAAGARDVFALTVARAQRSTSGDV